MDRKHQDLPKYNASDGKIYHQWCPTPQREHDISLMLAFQQKYSKQKKKLSQLNRCRIWLNAISLSDITDACGYRICPHAAKGEKHPHRQTIYTWRNQHKISNKHWKTWTKAVKTTFTTDGVHLHTPLGDWCTQGEPSQKWLTYEDASDDLFISPTGVAKHGCATHWWR